MNNENLIIPTSKQARENGKKGGIASQRKQKQKKQLREMFQEFCKMKPTDEKVAELESLGYNTKDITNMTAWIVSLFDNGTKGNSKALELGFNLMQIDKEKELKIKRQEMEIERLNLECEKLRQEMNTSPDTYEDLTPLADKLGWSDKE